jgi:2-succinyl-6-hydroxy-2,4-cyclohexadiene-1-carboxylate synthase
MGDLRIVVGGVGLQVRDDGGKKEAILFLHYGGGNLMMWEPVVPYFRDTHRCMRLDLRGHGRSDAPPAGYSIEDMAADVAGVLDALHIDCAHIVGSSLGAEVGLALAVAYPQRTLSLVCDGAFHSEYGPYGIHEAVDVSVDEEVRSQIAADRAKPELTYDSAEALINETRSDVESWGTWNESMEAIAAYNALELDDGRIVHAWRKWARDEYTDHYVAARFEEYYGAIECPVIILPGEREAADVMISDAMTGFSRLADRCQIVHVAGAVHPFGWLLIPEAMSEAVLDFIAEARP